MNSSFVDEDEPLIQVVGDKKPRSVSLDDAADVVADESPSSGIPNRLAMLNLSYVFLVAAVLLTAGFAMLHVAAPPTRTFINATFLVSCVLWLYGFTLLLQWTRALPGPTDTWGLVAASCKWIASVLFCVQPVTALWADSWGCAWSNLAGICCFHLGNCVSVLAMRKMFAFSAPLSFANLPVYGMWCYFSATTLLVIANTCFYAQIPWSATAAFAAVQIAGGSFLVLGSLLFIYWAGCVRFL
jgi:hypothetical protein